MIENIKTDFSWLDWYNLALHCSQTNEKESAKTLFAKAHRECTDSDSRLQCCSGFANLLKNGENDQWRLAMKELQAEKVNSWQEWINASTAAIGAIELEDALKYASKALEVGGLCIPDSWASLASVYSLMGKTSESVECFRKAKEFNQEYSQYYALQCLADTTIVKDDVFFNQFFHNYSYRKTATPCVNVLEYDTSNMNVLVCMEQGIGDAIMLRRAIHWLSGRCKNLTLLCRQEHVEFYGSFIWPNVTSNGTVDADLKINLMDMLVALPQFIDFKTPKPWENYGTLFSSSFDGKIGINFTGNPYFPFEKLRGVHDPEARKEMLRVVGEEGMEIPKTGISLNDLPQHVKRLRGLITSCTMLAHLAGEMNVPTLLLLSPGYDWRWNFKFYDSVYHAVSHTAGKWDFFEHTPKEGVYASSSFKYLYESWVNKIETI